MRLAWPRSSTASPPGQGDTWIAGSLRGLRAGRGWARRRGCRRNWGRRASRRVTVLVADGPVRAMVPHARSARSRRHCAKWRSRRSTLALSAPVTPGLISALSTRLTRGALAATASTACLTTPITSSQSPSIVVNMASVRFVSPLSRTTRTASATYSATPSPTPSGVIENATSIRCSFAGQRLDRYLQEDPEKITRPGGAPVVGTRPRDPFPHTDFPIMWVGPTYWFKRGGTTVMAIPSYIGLPDRSACQPTTTDSVRPARHGWPDPNGDPWTPGTYQAILRFPAPPGPERARRAHVRCRCRLRPGCPRRCTGGRARR